MDSPIGNGRVQVAYLHPHHVSHSWHESMMRLAAYDSANDARVVSTNGPFMISCDAGGLVSSRNLGVRKFLDETDHEWMWWIDTDMGFLPDTVDRLVDAADPAERPVVGALCFALRELVYDGYGGRRVMPVPTLYVTAQAQDGMVGFTNRFEYPDNTLVQVAGTGSACMLLHRTALEKVRAQWGDAWYEPVRYGNGQPISEDLSLCARLGQAGIPVHVHTGIKTTHHKQFWVGEDDYAPPQLRLAPPGADAGQAVDVAVAADVDDAA